MAQKKRGPSATKEPDPGSAETARARPRRPERTLRQVVQTLALPRLEVSEAARRVNQLRDLLVRAVAKNLLSCDYVRVGAGSYYEHVKVKGGRRPWLSPHTVSSASSSIDFHHPPCWG